MGQAHNLIFPRTAATWKRHRQFSGPVGLLELHDGVVKVLGEVKPGLDLRQSRGGRRAEAYASGMRGAA